MGIPKGQADPGSDPSPPNHEVRRFNGFTVNLTARELFHGDFRVEVEPKVFEILALLLRTPGRVVTYAEFKNAIWPNVQVELVENVNVLASKLRETLNEASGTRYVLNKRGEGYYFNPKVKVECALVQISEGETVAVGPDVPKAQPPQWSIRRNLTLWALATVLAIVSIIAAAMWLQPQPNDFKVESNSLVVVNARGREMWRHVFPWPLHEAPYATQELRLLHCWLGDLNGDGEHQLVFGTIPIDRMGAGTPVLCFRADGKVRWQFVPGRAVWAGDSENMLPPYWANSVAVIQGKRPIDTRIVISSNHYSGATNQVAFLDVNGKLIGEYWHPGHLLHLAQVDLDGDGRKELLLGGVSNGNHQATLVVLDPVKMSGSVTPKDMRDHRFELLGMPAASERTVVLFPRSSISNGQPFTRVHSINISRDRIIVEVIENMEEDIGIGFVYEFDYSLNIVNVGPNNGVRVAKAHQELETQGKLDHPIDFAKELAVLKAGVVVRRGN